MIELRENVKGNYKGYLYARSLDEAKDIKKIIENGLIGKLANELTEELDLKNLNLENSENISDVFTNLVSSEN